MTPSEKFTPSVEVGPDYIIAEGGEVSGTTAAAEAFIAPADTSIAVRSMGDAESGTVVLTLEVGSQEHARITLRLDLTPDDATALAERIAACADAVGEADPEDDEGEE